MAVKQPIELVVAKGKSHRTKEEIKQRMETEVKVADDHVIPPDYLNKEQKEKFEVYCKQLQKLKIINETDQEALARYVIAQEEYELIVESLRVARGNWEIYDKAFNAFVKSNELCRKLASDLGMTISSRCKLVVPQKEEPKENKFSKFAKASSDG